MSHVTKQSRRRTGSTWTSIQFAHLFKKKIKRGIVTVLVSCGCYHIFPQIWCFWTTRIYSLTFLETRSLKSANQGSRGSWKNPFLASSSFQWLLALFWLMANLLPLSSHCLFLFVCHISLCLYLIRTLVTACGPIQMIQDHLPICSVQLLSRVRLFVTPWTAARQASMSITNSLGSPKLTSIESVMPSSHLILWHPLLLLPSIFPSIRDFSNELSFSFSISPCN